MSTIDTRPEQVDINHYAGDTLTLTVTAPAQLTDGMTWNAQVKGARDDAVSVDAEFTVTPPAVSGGPATLVLTAAQTKALATLGEELRVMSGGQLVNVLTYKGAWDVQISDAGNDPVITLAQGILTIEMDVTRLP